MNSQATNITQMKQKYKNNMMIIFLGDEIHCACLYIPMKYMI